MKALAAALVFLCSACTVPRAVEDVSEEAPPPALGRPGWVRGAAGIGAWIGAIGGGVVSIVTLPITYPITLIADEPLGYAKQEFLFFPVTAGASAGHYLLGAPTDMVDFVFRRAWVDSSTEHDYAFTPMAPPSGLEAPRHEEPAPAAEPKQGEVPKSEETKEPTTEPGRQPR